MAVAKVIEITAASTDSFEAAIRQGIAKASETVRNIQAAWVKEQQVKVSDDGSISEVPRRPQGHVRARVTPAAMDGA
jgi:flavin-binding protein dodecin